MDPEFKPECLGTLLEMHVPHVVAESQDKTQLVLYRREYLDEDTGIFYPSVVGFFEGYDIETDDWTIIKIVMFPSMIGMHKVSEWRNFIILTYTCNGEIYYGVLALPELNSSNV